MLRRLLAVLMLVLAGSSVAAAERVQDLPAPTNYVNDFAGVLSAPTLASLNAMCAQLDRQAHAQIAVVTVKTLDGEPIENFATALEDKWKVGKKGTDRGLLLILATDDRKYRIEVGYGLEGILPDGRVGNIGRAMIPYLQQNNFDGAVSMAVTQMAQIIAADAGVTLTNAPRRGPPQVQPLTLGQMLVLGLILLAVIFFLARFGGSGLLGFLIGMFMGGGGGRGSGWGGGGGGGFGGGDGGGFGGFGGGSSGGGGASGSW